MTGARPAAGTNHRGEVIRCVQSTTSRKHGVFLGRRQSRRDRQADSSTRPLRRRAARMARPARVCIRSRKPWVFARRRLFGWKVRLLTGISPLSGTAGMASETAVLSTTDPLAPLRTQTCRGAARNGRNPPDGVKGTDSRADGSNSAARDPAVPAGPTRRPWSLPRSRSCGKSRKVVSVPGALGITEFPGATIRVAFAAAWAAVVSRTCPHLWTTSVDD